MQKMTISQLPLRHAEDKTTDDVTARRAWVQLAPMALLSTLFLAACAALLLTGLWARPAGAQTAPAVEQTLATAGQLYANGQYELAAQAYQQIIDQGYADSVLYYNMGVAYSLQGDLGRALWSLRSAQELTPRDPEIRAALKQTRTQLAEINDVTTTATPTLLGRTADASKWALSINELAVTTLGLWLALALLLLVFVLRVKWRPLRRMARMLTPIFGLLLVVMTVTLGARLVQMYRQPPAVVVAAETAVVAGPGPQYTAQYSLPSGAEVVQLEIRGDWVRIGAIANNPDGWVPRHTVLPIQPLVGK